MADMTDDDLLRIATTLGLPFGMLDHDYCKSMEIEPGTRSHGEVTCDGMVRFARAVIAAAQPAPPDGHGGNLDSAFDAAPAVPDDMVALIQRVRDAAHWQLIEGNGDDETHRALYAAADALERLSAAPAVREATDKESLMVREPLTDGQVIDIRKHCASRGGYPWEDSITFARAIERAHGITGDSK